MFMSYAVYLAVNNKKDSRTSWVDWKVDVCNMEPDEASKASRDPDWGYTPLKEK